jgi:tRNA (guanine37-N1)-methyltransferase
MKIHIVTLFPEMFRGFLAEGILSGAIDRGLVSLDLVNPRDFTDDRHRVVDDAPYGGFAGMVLTPEPIFRAIESIFAAGGPRPRVVLTCPQGAVFTHETALRLAEEPGLVLIAGRYKAVDERVRENLVDEEVSIGDYVLSGGELPAMVVADAVVRLLPGVLGDPDSARSDSFFEGLLDAGYYTRPEVFRGHAVPPVLLSGHHDEVRRWRRREALRRTLARRPDLLDRASLTDEDRRLLAEIRNEALKTHKR